MRGDRHLVIGAGLGCFVAQQSDSLELTGVIIGATAIASLLPDLDVEGSLASKWGTRGMGLLTLGASCWAGWQLAAITANVPLSIGAGVALLLLSGPILGPLAPYRIFAHRGLMHTPFCGALVAATCAALLITLDIGPQTAALVGLAVFVGWLSHLLADSLTKYGLPLGKPFFEAPLHEHRYTRIEHGRRISHRYWCSLFHVTPAWLRFRSGSRVEWLLALPVLLAGMAKLLV